MQMKQIQFTLSEIVSYSGSLFKENKTCESLCGRTCYAITCGPCAPSGEVK